MSSISLSSTGNRAFDFVCLWVLPAGLFLLLSALFFLPDRSPHHKLYYALFSIPTLLALCARPRALVPLLREPLVLLFLLFAGFAVFSILWSPVANAADLVKRPLHTLMLFLGTALLLLHRPETFKPILLGAGLLALLAVLRDLPAFALAYVPGTRFIGAGALDNPLLSSHLFGFFCIYWLCMALDCKRLSLVALYLAAFAIMFAAVLATGSRTPLLALVLAVNWVALLRRDRRSIALFAAAPVALVLICIYAPQLITERGTSYRLDIWQSCWERFLDHPWIGHGYDAPLSIDVGIGYVLTEPHNFALGVLYNVGIIGFLPWVGMLACGLYYGWKYRASASFRLASTLLMFGIGAGLTEGGGILSRPKEHWFLLWIPLALLAGLSIARHAGRLVLAARVWLEPAQALHMAQGARIIEEDGRGPKVLQLDDGSFLKLFRRRPWYTWGNLYPYAQRFVLNGQQLPLLGIATPQVLELITYADGSQGVHYRPLPGRTLRQVLQDCPEIGERRALVRRLGQFIAVLHEQGVYFRSLHLGNVLLLDDDTFGLIDLADLRLRPSPLPADLRRRNLRHMQRYPQDRHWLFEENVEALLDGYASKTDQALTEVVRTHVQSPTGTAQ